MEDGYRLIDYGININDVVQLMIRAAPVPNPKVVQKVTEEQTVTDEADDKEKKDTNKTGDESLIDVVCEYYEVKI
jgi:hypothetical protein